MLLPMPLWQKLCTNSSYLAAERWGENFSSLLVLLIPWVGYREAECRLASFFTPLSASLMLDEGRSWASHWIPLKLREQGLNYPKSYHSIPPVMPGEAGGLFSTEPLWYGSERAGREGSEFTGPASHCLTWFLVTVWECSCSSSLGLLIPGMGEMWR